MIVSASGVLATATFGKPLGADAASLNLSWRAPTTNVDGSPLTDLVGYYVYVSSSTPACSGGPSTFVASEADPSEGETVSYLLSGLTAGKQYTVAVTALDAADRQSDCSNEASAVASVGFTVSPTSADFGAALVGTSVDRTFTVQNTTVASRSVTVSAPAPFSVVSGGSYTIAPGATADVVVRFSPSVDATFTANLNFSNGDGDTASRALTGTATLSVPPPPGTPSLSVFYAGKLRDRVGSDTGGLTGDGAPDGTLTATLSAVGGRTITRLRLQSSAPGSWDTDVTTPAWILGVASALDGSLLNIPGTMAVNVTVADGGTFYLFAADFADSEFAPGTMLTVTADFSDGTTATAITFATAVVPTAPPSITLAYDGKRRDRVGAGSSALGSDGLLDGTFTATLMAAGGRTITRLVLVSSAGGSWDTDATTASWVLGIASTLDGAPLNDPTTMAVNVTVPDGGRFQLFAADFAGLQFVTGQTLTLTATFEDGTNATGVTVAGLEPPPLALTYDGKLRDRVGPSNQGLAGDGALDGTFTATFTGIGNRSVTRLELRSSAGGSWDTDPATSPWVLGLAAGLDTPVLNDASGINLAVSDSATVRLFAADFADVQFAPGTTLTLTATFSDGTRLTASTVATALPLPSLSSLVYFGKIRDRVRPGPFGLGADGALDGTFRATLSAAPGRIITRVQLQNTSPNGSGRWDSDASSGAWLLGLAMGTLDGALVNNETTMAVNVLVPPTASTALVLFAADFNDAEFSPGTTFELTVTFSDATTLRKGVVIPPVSAALTLSYDGNLRDRVGRGNTALFADGALDGTFTVTLFAPGGRTITGLELTSQSSVPFFWETDVTALSVLGVANTLDGALLNDPDTMAVNFPVADKGSFRLFASDFADVQFATGTTLTLTATFSDGTSASAETVVAPTIALVYNGKLRDRVGGGGLALGADGALDGTLTATLFATGGRTITRLQLQSSAPGTWDTDGSTPTWVLGVADTLDSALLNDPATMAVNLVVGDGRSFQLFAADFADIEFVSGTTLVLIATFSDGTSTVATTTVP